MYKYDGVYIIELTNLASIIGNAKSLSNQLQEYDFLTVTKEQSQRLENIEIQLANLRKEITKSN